MTVSAPRKAHKLDQLGFVGRGRSRHRPRNDPSLYGGEVPFFQTGDVKAAELYLHEYSQTYNDKGLAQSKLWEPGTLCITIAANIAESAVLAVPGCFPDSVVGFIADPSKANTVFVKYYLDTLKLAMQSASRGTTQDNLSLDKLLTFDFVVPEVDEQRRIASILSTYDDLIENNTRRIAILEEMARRLYEEWFVKFRFPGYEEANLDGGYPADWSQSTINDYCLVTDYVANGSFASLKQNVTYRDVEDYAVLVRTKDYKAGWRGDYVYVPEQSYLFLRKSSLSPGDIVVGNVGNVGLTFLVPDLKKPMTLGPNAVLVRPKRHAPYVYYYLQSDLAQHRIKGIVSGAAQPKFNKTEFRRLPLPMPPEPLTERFCNTVETLLRKCELLRQKNTNLRTQRDLLLPKLVSGEIDVSEAEDLAEETAA